MVQTGYPRRKPATRSAVAFGTMVCVALFLPSNALIAQAAPAEPVVRVEEDWELVLLEPDDGVYAPQLHTVMSPTGHLDYVFAQATWNYWELPDFQPGGIQMQAWDSQSLLVERGFGSATCSTIAETITWTQTLESYDGQVAFKIKDGDSTTWGAFGYPGENMHIRGYVGLANLNAYNPQVSVANSGVTFGGNRVASLAITEVRWYGASGLLQADSTRRTVFQGE